VKGRLVLFGGEKATLAEIAHRLGRKALQEVAATAQPDTILGWYRKLIARKFDGSKFRQRAGRPKIHPEIEDLVVRMARENPGWGYDRIVGALANLGHRISDQTVGNILKRRGLSPGRKRRQTVRWRDFIRSHMAVLAGADFFTVEILTLKGQDAFPQLFSLLLRGVWPDSAVVRNNLRRFRLRSGGQLAFAVQISPELAAIVKALGVLGPDGNVSTDWFGNPLDSCGARLGPSPFGVPLCAW
jgi:transposase